MLKDIKMYICKEYKDEINKYNSIIKEIFDRLKEDEIFNKLINDLKNTDIKSFKTIQSQFYTIDTETCEITYIID